MKTSVERIEFGDWVKTPKGDAGRVVGNVLVCDYSKSLERSTWKVLCSDGVVRFYYSHELTMFAKDSRRSGVVLYCPNSDNILTTSEAQKRGWCKICKSLTCPQKVIKRL